MTERTELVAFRRWLDTLSYNGLRALESSTPTFLPTGRRLRGVEFVPGLWLLRNRTWARVVTDGPYASEVTPLDDATAMKLLPLPSAISAFRRLCRDRAFRRDHG